MSINITKFKVKELENFIIPVHALYLPEGKNFHPDRINNDDGSVTYDMGESHIKGHLIEDFLMVEDVEIIGEGSGSTLHYLLIPAFKYSTGRFVALCIWEEGTVEYLIVDKGEVGQNEVEL